MRTTRTTTVAAAALAVLFTSAAPALLGGGRAVAATAVDPAAARRDEAKAAFTRGNTAYNLGKYGDAIAEFERAYALSRLPEILFNLGQCYRKQWETDRRSELGRRALHYYEALVREAPTAKVRPDAEQFITEIGPAVAAAEARERQRTIASAKGSEALKVAQSMFAGGHFNDAAGVLDRLLREPDSTRELLAEAYLLRGRVAAAVGDPLAAEAQFRRALELRPALEIPEPRGQEIAALDAARKTMGGGLRLVQTPLGEAAPNQIARIDVRIEGDSEKLVAELELGYRAADTGAFMTTRAKPPVTLAVPGPMLAPGARVDYYVRALDEHGSVLADSGTPTLPFRLQVAVPFDLRREPAHFYQKWWFWTLVGAAAAGAGAITYIETRPKDSNELVIQGDDRPVTMRRHHFIVCGLAAAAAVAAAACTEEEQGPGIAVSVDLAQFAADVRKLTIAFSASGGGFVAQAPGNVDNVGVATEDVDGDGTLELVTTFLNPAASISFRVETGNQTQLTVWAQALAFNETSMIAGADSDPGGTALPVGGRGSIALTLAERSGGVIGPDTRITDIKAVAPDIAVNSLAPARFSAVAVCDADGDGTQDLVLGAPATEYLIGSVGAVYVVFGGNGLGSAIDLGDPTTLMEFHFYGENPGDQLGASLACADLNNDDIGDLIVGAPGAGRVYAVFGSTGLRNRTVTPGATDDTSPDVTWVSAAGGGFGAKLVAAELDGDKSAEILVSAPGSMKVHLLAGVDRPIAAPIDVDGTDHVTFSNVVASSLAMGDLTRSAAADVIIGDSDAKMVNSTIARGVVYVFPSVMLDGTTQYDAQATDALGPGLIMFGGEDMQFGAAVLALDTTGGGQDLIVGAPGASDAAGAFYVYEGDTAFFDVKMRDYLEIKAVKLGPIANGRFGAALAGTPSGTAPSYSKWDLLVGAYTTSRGSERPLVGAAYLFGGRPGRDFPLYEQVFGAEPGDQLGTVVAGGQVDQADTIGDLVMIAPFAQFGGAASGAVYVRFNHYGR